MELRDINDYLPKLLKNIESYQFDCKVKDCDINVFALGYCVKHYKRVRTHNDSSKVIYDRDHDDFCSIFNCNEKYLAKGYCRKHYKRFKAHGDPLKTLINVDHTEFCSISGCNEKYDSKGLCTKHYEAQPHRRKKSNEFTRRWYKENPDKVAIINIKRLEKISKKLNITSNYYMILINIWAKVVKHRDNNKCVICESTENLNAHHIILKKDYPELSLNINNGITLCENNHYEVHGKMLIKN